MQPARTAAQSSAARRYARAVAARRGDRDDSGDAGDDWDDPDGSSPPGGAADDEFVPWSMASVPLSINDPGARASSRNGFGDPRAPLVYERRARGAGAVSAVLWVEPGGGGA